ncbi:MAG: AAA domain-containing protein [Acutalibacteraceae bacterium]
MKAGKRILIAAPTNNAVEQTLYGVLEVFEEAGIDYKGKLLRLGMASAAFAGKYPDACEDRVQIKLLASLTSQLQTVSADISKLEAHLKGIQSYEKLQNTWKSFSNIKTKAA